MPHMNVLDARASGIYLDLLVRMGNNRNLMAIRTTIFDSNIVPEFKANTGKSFLSGSLLLDIKQLEMIPADWLQRMREAEQGTIEGSNPLQIEATRLQIESK